jgi:hypothetical protein
MPDTCAVTAAARIGSTVPGAVISNGTDRASTWATVTGTVATRASRGSEQVMSASTAPGIRYLARTGIPRRACWRRCAVRFIGQSSSRGRLAARRAILVERWSAS